MKKVLSILAAALTVAVVEGATYFVDNVKGSDRNPGSQEKPFASIGRGLRALKSGDRLEVANNPGVPYTRPYPGDKGAHYYITAAGTADKPTVINGNGAIVSGLSEIPEKTWKEVAKGIYSMPFWPMSNEFRGYRKQDYWLEDLKIWFVDGKLLPNTKSRQEMEKTPGSFYWSRGDKQLYFHLPEGKKLGELKIQLPSNGGFYITRSNITVENFIFTHSWNDGFDTAYDVKNAVFRNCVAVSNCGQGFSSHEAGEALYEDCGAFNCGSSGITNVNNSKVTYVRCVIARNVFEPGIKSTQNAYLKVVDSLIIGNEPQIQIGAYVNSSMDFINCVIRGSYLQPVAFVKDGKMNFEKCTIVNGSSLYLVHPSYKGVMTVKDSLVGCLRNAPVASKNLVLENVTLFKTPGAADNGGCGIDPQAMKTAEKVPVIEGKGAKLPDSVWKMYMKYKNAMALPERVDLNGRK